MDTLKVYITKNILNYEIWFIEYITSHLNSLNMKKTKIYGVRNPGPGLWQAQTFGGLKLVNGQSQSPLLINGSPTTMQM